MSDEIKMTKEEQARLEMYQRMGLNFTVVKTYKGDEEE